MATRRGDTLIFPKPPVIAAHACIGGKKEGESPLAAEFDELHSDNRLGQASWEAAETQLQLQAARLCLKKAHATEKDVSLLLAGDLQAQCTASGYAARALGLPFAGLFGACSTMAEALGVGACLCSAGMADGLLAMTSSHFCTAERQFRTPLSYGAVRTPTAQWTATAAGACLLRPAGQGVGIRAVTFGRVQDLGIRDINNMGAAMAPAAAAPMVLTDLERKSLAGERELLTMLTSYPDLFRTYADRICSIEWVDPRHESIAWAVLATPPGTDPAACMDAARSVCPEAATLVSAGRISATSKHPTETNIVFMLDTLELYTIKRRMRAAQAKLRQDRSLDDEARRALTVQAAQDSQRQRELQKSIGGVADPFRLIGLEAAGTEQA